MALPPEIRDWIDRSTVDHIGPFVNAWAGFNAWYRHVSNTQRDRDGLDFVRTRPNVIRSAILPLLDPDVPDTQDATEFKTAIAALHTALEAFRLETLYDDTVEHVSFRSVPLSKRERLPATDRHRGISYRVEFATQKWHSSVTTAAGNALAQIVQPAYDMPGLQQDWGIWRYLRSDVSGCVLSMPGARRDRSPIC